MNSRPNGRRLRAAIEGSLVARALQGRGVLTPHDRRLPATEALEREAAWLRERAAASYAGRWSRFAAAAVVRMWRGSSAREAIDRIREAVRPLSAADRVRAAGIWAASAAIADLLVTPFDPRPTSVERWLLWAALVSASLTAAIYSEGVVIAWNDWRRRRAQ